MHRALITYLTRHKERIEQHYNWTFDEKLPTRLFGFRFQENTPFLRNIELKRQLTEAAKDADAPTKQRLAEYVIQQWGGIRRFSKCAEVVTRFDAIAGRPRSRQQIFDFENISSWSKWLSIVCPDWAAIYDARVAYSLNGVNFLSGAPARVFPIPTGRNTTMNLLDAGTLALSVRLAKEHGPLTSAQVRDLHYWAPSDVYDAYLDAIHAVHSELWPRGTPLSYTEMLLFALADTIVFHDVVARLRHFGASLGDGLH